MKKQILLLFICGLFASCNNNAFIIEGRVEAPELEGKTVYKQSSMFFLDYGKVKPQMDSTIIKDGKYRFEMEVANPDYCTVYIPGQTEDKRSILYETIAIEKGKVNVVTDSILNTTVTGTPLNDVFNKHEVEYEKVQDRFYIAYNKRQEAQKNGTVLSEEESKHIESEISECRKLFVEMDYNFTKENINNPAVWNMKLYNTAIQAGTSDKMKELIAGADEYTKTLLVYKEISDIIATLNRTAVGQPFTDFKMLDPNDKEVSLSDYVGKGKYVLVDFWASWCGPCRAEMPNVIKAYKKYAGKDFEIVGVSLDSKKESWVKAIKEMNLPWPHMSDLKAWDCEGAKLYGVKGVPSTILFDKEGRILARNLRGEELYTKLEELLK